MMEGAINSIINEPTLCLCNQKVPFSSLTYSNKQWEVKTVVIAQAQPAVRSSQARLITPQFLHARSFTLAALETARSLMVLGKCGSIITPSTGLLNVGQVNSFNLKLFKLACCVGIREIWRRFHVSNPTSKVNLFIPNDTEPAHQRLRAVPL